jgi:hypothetical protein
MPLFDSNTTELRRQASQQLHSDLDQKATQSVAVRAHEPFAFYHFLFAAGLLAFQLVWSLLRASASIGETRGNQAMRPGLSDGLPIRASRII